MQPQSNLTRFFKKHLVHTIQIHSFTKNNSLDFGSQKIILTIKKRFSDFENLSKYLKCAFQVALIPSLPPKHISINFLKNSEVLFEREFGLLLFLNYTFLSPILCQSQFLQDFIFVVW